MNKIREKQNNPYQIEIDSVSVEHVLKEVTSDFKRYFMNLGYNWDENDGILNPYHAELNEPFFITDQLTAWRNEVCDISKFPDVGVATIQECLRTQVLNMYKTGTYPPKKYAEFGSYFRMLSVLTKSQSIIPDGWRYLTDVLLIPAHNIRIKVSKRDTDIIEMMIRSGIPGSSLLLMDETSNSPANETEANPGYFQWSYGEGNGLSAFFGRGVTFSIRSMDSKNFIDIGNLIAVKNEQGKIILWDYGFGLENTIRVLRGRTHNSESSEIFSLIEILTAGSIAIPVYEMYIFADTLTTVFQMILNGITLRDKGRGGKILREYISVLRTKIKLYNIDARVLDVVFKKYIELNDTVFEKNNLKQMKEQIDMRALLDIKKTRKSESEKFEELLDEEALKIFLQGILGMAELPSVGVALSKIPEIDLGSNIITHGRIISLRKSKNIWFFDITMDGTLLQVAFEVGDISPEQIKKINIILGKSNIVEVEGTLITAKSGELTLLLSKFPKMLTPALSVDPRNSHEIRKTRIENQEILDSTNRVLGSVKRFFDENGFVELDTGILHPKASGANARSFQTYMNATQQNRVLRIAPEIALKTAMVKGNHSKVYELGNNFRNEGIDSTHYPEFRMLEAYEAFVTLPSVLPKITKLIRMIVSASRKDKGLVIDVGGNRIDFSKQIPTVQFFDLLSRYSNYDFVKLMRKDEQTIRKELQNIGAKYGVQKQMTIGAAIDTIYKKVVRPKIIQPTFVTDYPISMLPLARAYDHNPMIAMSAQLVVAGAEIVKVYQEQTDPEKQYKALYQQMQAKIKGDEEAMPLDTDFIYELTKGLPPCVGFGIGIDRFLAMLLTNNDIRVLRSVIHKGILK